VNSQLDSIPLSTALSLSRIVKPEAGWYRGDFHAHTNFSDGYYPPPELADVARSEALDFFTISDHNTIAAFERFGPQPDLLIIPGVEATFDEVHFNAFGVERQSDWMNVICTGKILTKLDGHYGSFSELLARLAGEGLLNSINHPLLAPWACLDKEIDLRHVHCLEIWNDPSLPDNEQANPQAVELWTRSLNAGHRITAIGGSDYHRPTAVRGERESPERLGHPATYVFANELSGNAILDGLRRRRAYVTLGPLLSFRAFAGDSVYEIGDDLGPIRERMTLAVNVKAGSSAANSVARILKDGQVIGERTFSESQDSPLEVIVEVEPDAPAWYRFDLMGEQGEHLAITNPIFVGPERIPSANTIGDFL